MSILHSLRSLEGDLGWLEPAFRADHLWRDRRHCQALVLLSVLAAMVAGSWQFDGDPLATGTVLAGSGLAVLGLATLALLNRTRTAAMLDGIVLAWAALFILGVAIVLCTSDTHAGYPGVMVVVVVLWNVLPQPLEIRALTALLLTLPITVVVFGNLAEQPGSAIVDLVALLVANVFGAWFSIDHHRLARVRYQLLDISRRTRDRAARMQRLLPVCAWCGALRDEAGYWRAVHEFVDSDELESTARTVCDDCTVAGDATLRGPAAIDREGSGSFETWESAKFSSARRHAAVLMGATMLIVVGLMAESLLDETGSVLASTSFGIRMLELVICGLVLMVALFTRNRRLFEGILIGWASLMGLAILILSYLGTTSLSLSVIALATISWALLLPVSRWQRAIPACMALAGGLLFCFGPNAPEGLGPLAHQYAAVLIAGLVVGLAFSTVTEGRRRRLFEATRDAQMEQRLVERLGELLPVCRVCHSVRDEDGYWRDVRAYLRGRVGGRATHGICDDCLEEEVSVDSHSNECRHGAPAA